MKRVHDLFLPISRKSQSAPKPLVIRSLYTDYLMRVLCKYFLFVIECVSLFLPHRLQPSLYNLFNSILVMKEKRPTEIK